jgi:RNA polymerase sigma-54 factor
MQHSFSQNLSQRQSQLMVLAPQLRQSLKILQVAALDLRATIAEELQEQSRARGAPMENVSMEKAQADSDTSDSNDQREGDEVRPRVRGPREDG